eukprot:c12964_g1_i1.p1 GENE.c12964_g1_i1~~c12964_g1_i1.p1  ORF type:complete len:190 (+),score=67.74 c12964_g1_i1:443-1012(+)
MIEAKEAKKLELFLNDPPFGHASMLVSDRNRGGIKRDRRIIIVDEKSRSLAHIAAAIIDENSPNCLALLLKTGLCDWIDVDKHQETPLHIAASNNNVVGVKLLLSPTDPFPEGQYQSYWISGEKWLDSQNVRGHTALHIASAKGHKQIVQILLEHGAESLTLDKKGKSAIELAKQNDHKDIAQLLEKYV